MGDGKPCAGAAADFRGGDVDLGELEGNDPVAPAGIQPGEVFAGPGNRHDRRQFEYPVRRMPGVDLEQAVGPDDEVERTRPAVNRPQRLQRVNGVGQAGTFDLRVRHLEPGIVPRGQLRHAVPVIRRGDGVSPLVRRAGGGDEQEPVEGATLDDAQGNDQVAGVDRVERTPVNAKPLNVHGELPLSDSAGEDPSVAGGLFPALPYSADGPD